tara:strand:+ start:311 stop:517 length:207 start_codon:yes stop_codon:yes gene_type:complete
MNEYQISSDVFQDAIKESYEELKSTLKSEITLQLLLQIFIEEQNNQWQDITTEQKVLKTEKTMQEYVH